MRVPDSAGHRSRMMIEDREELSDVTGVETGDESLVQQQFANEVDINTIVRRFGITRNMPFGEVAGVYGDFTGIVDYEDAVARVRRAQDGFESLPAEVRDRFFNNPGKLIEYAATIPPDRLQEDLFGPVAPPVPPVVVDAPPVT